MKKRSTIRLLLLLGYCVPVSFLTMLGEAQWNTTALYFPWLICAVLLSAAAFLNKSALAILLGTALNAAVCFLCLAAALPHFPALRLYYLPMNAWEQMGLLCGGGLAVQLLIAALLMRERYRKEINAISEQDRVLLFRQTLLNFIRW